MFFPVENHAVCWYIMNQMLTIRILTEGILTNIVFLTIKIELTVYAVLEQNQWNDINLDHGFFVLHDLPSNGSIRYTISESTRIEIYRCLANLN